MLKQRLLTAAILLPLLLAGMFLLPNPAWALLILVPAALGALEWSKLAGLSGAPRNGFVAAVVLSGLLLILAQWRAPALATNAAVWLYLLALLFWAIVVPAWLYFKWRVSAPALMILAGWVVLLPAWLAVATLQKSAALLLMLLLVIWIADTAAYFAGRRFGRRKLAPQISPGKTWEGVIGAIVAVLIYGFAIGFVLQPEANFYNRAGLLVFICVMTAFSIIGDLFESWIKRQAGAKDSGELLPGHGGILDRIDSVTAAMPFAALYFLQTT
jgi:phosphatidate cytidylyltransferase